MRSKNQEASHDAVCEAPTSILVGASIFYSIVLHCSTVKMLLKLYQKILTKFGALGMHMTELLIGSTFKALGTGPNLYTFQCFRCWVAPSNNLATLRLKWMTWSVPRNASAYFLFIRNMRQCRGQSEWCKELPGIATTNVMHFSSFQGAASYTLVLIISSILLSREVFLNALSISYIHFLAEPHYWIWIFVVSVVCCQRSLRRTDHSSRGVLPTVLRRRVWSRNIKNGCSIYIYMTLVA
jgi:hypothetical protein